MSEDFQPTGPIRSGSIYVSWQVRKALNYIAAASKDAEACTADGVADKVLSEWLAANHAPIMAWLERREAEEKEFKKGLKK